MISIAIVDDELLFVKQLQNYIERYALESGREIKVFVFSDGEDIAEDYKGKYDIILMDIQMRFMDGMTAAEKIRSLDGEVIIMFITNMTQHAIRGYAVDALDALDYVLKPIEYFAFSQKLDKAISRIKHEKKAFITVTTENGMQKLAVLDIYYIESQGHNAIYHSKEGEFRSRITLKELESKMEDKGFFRCSKGYLVNMKKVDKISGNDCIISNERVPISRSKKKEFMQLLLCYMNEE